MKNLLEKFNKELKNMSLLQRLEMIADKFPKAVFTSSLGLEDQALTWAIAKNWAIANGSRNIKIVTLQTGRLFLETIELIKTTNERFGLNIIELTPSAASVEEYSAKYGLNGFYDSIQARKACCDFRKIAPLKKGLEGADAWITGLRADQSGYRSQIEFAQWDKKFSLIKFNPLADFSSEKLGELIEENNIPVNPLHKRNYPSIGCEPCTRAIKPGEDERAGRWWWERDQNQECGLHEPEPQPTNHPAN
ncbi:MAG: phosphoadenylyl-sulfate reductase [Devosiaceae bacterium]|nr:phosphoadenylyl-sulfate reductase [Devosiaceae bacterium]